MSYFTYFPSIYYNYEIDGKTVLIAVKDIALNTRVRKEIIDNIVMYDEYDIEDGETPEIISEKLYGKPFYHWTILLVNLRFDYLRDFPMREIDLERYVTEKYGTGNEYAQHIMNGQLHFEDADGNVVSKLTEEMFNVQNTTSMTYEQYSRLFKSISNYDYESRLNESKRRIKVLNPTVLEKAISDIQRLMKDK